MGDKFANLSDEERAAKAYDALLTYLTASPRSEKECKEKLYQKGYRKGEVEAALERAKKYRYIDDEEYVKAFLSYYKDKYGKKKLSYKLTAEKGIDKNIVDRLLDEAISDGEEEEKCRRAAQKFVAQKKITDKSGAQKTYAHLYQKGFENGVISKVVATIFDSYEDD